MRASYNAGGRSARTSRSLLLIIGILGSGLLVYSASTGSPLSYSDEQQYLEIARSISHGDGYALAGSPTAYRPPAWPALLALPLIAGLPEHLLAIVPAVLMVAAAGVAACIGSRLAQSSWGALAGVAILLYPLNIYTATTLYPQAFATLLIMALWLTAIRISDSTQAKPTALYALSGLLAGLLALAVPTLALTGVVIILWVAIQARSDRLRALIIQGLGLAMPIAAWTLRNAAVIGSPVPLSTSGGINLLIGNNATATGSSGVGVAIEQYKSAAAHMNEVDADRYFRKSALEWIQSNPFDSLTLYIAKVANYFSPFNEPVTESQGTALQEIVAIASFTILVALLLLRVLLRRRRPLEPTERLFLGLFAANAFVMAIFFTRTRFRQPLDNILLVEAALACVIIIVHITKQNSRDSAGGEPQ